MATLNGLPCWCCTSLKMVNICDDRREWECRKTRMTLAIKYINEPFTLMAHGREKTGSPKCSDAVEMSLS